MKICPKCEKQCGTKKVEIKEEYDYKGVIFPIYRLVEKCLFCGEIIGSDEEDQKIIDEMVEERKSRKLWNILKDKWGFSKDACGDIVEAVAEWLPKPQSAAGSQNVYVECTVEGFNDCLTKIKGKLR
jgi:hypothetical protein